MLWSKELSDKLREKIIIALKSVKGYKKIAQRFDVNVSTVRQIVYKRGTLRRQQRCPEVADHAKSQLEQLDS